MRLPSIAVLMVLPFACAQFSAVSPVAITSVSGGTVGVAATGDPVGSDGSGSWQDDTASYPSEFEGVPTIRTDPTDRTTTGDTTQVAFTIDAPSQLCVLHADSVVAKPNWLTSTYDSIGYVGELQQEPATFYCADVAAGAKTMGGNCLSTCESANLPMYSVFVVPGWRHVPSISASPPDSEGFYRFNNTSVSNNDDAPFQRAGAARTGSTVGAATVEVYDTGTGTGVSGVDYNAITPVTYSWADGEGGTKCCVTITPIGAAVAGGETIILGFQNPSTGFAADASGGQTVTIELLDTAVDTIAMSAASWNCNEQAVCTGSATRTNADGSTASVNVGETTNPSCISGLTASLSWSASENGAKNFTATSADIAMDCSAGVQLSGVSGAALGTANATFEIAANVGAGNIVFRETFESYPLGCFNQSNCGIETSFGPGNVWITSSEPNGNATVASSSPVATGYNKYVRQYNVKNGTTNYRSELSYVGTPYGVAMTSLGGGDYVGEAYWYGYVVCLDTNNTSNGYGHYIDQSHVDVGNAAPGWALMSGPKNGDSANGYTMFFYIESSQEPPFGTRKVDLNINYIGQCFNVIWEVKPDTRLASEGSTGTLRLWVGSSSTPAYEWLNKQVTHGPANPPYGGDTYHPYFKFGGYQSSWRDGWGVNGQVWLARYDNFTVMDDTGSWAAMTTALADPD